MIKNIFWTGDRLGKLVLGLAVVTAGATTPQYAQAQTVSDAAPSNPSANCTWNWNYWRGSQSDNTSTGTSLARFDPAFRDDGASGEVDNTANVFQDSAAFQIPGGAAYTWYELLASGGASATSTDNAFGDSATGDFDGPANDNILINGSLWERMYGIGRYQMNPGTSPTITFGDSGVFDGHAFAFFGSDGTMLARLPAASSGYYANVSNATLAANIGTNDSNSTIVSGAWTASVTVPNVPADGIVYLHYAWADESANAGVATNDACQVPELSTTQ
ncbi:hypothetical protein DS901_05040, partial [Loktanella sp. D2R18]|uniref:hypothetical protein n=2 Tax=Rhodobacterales TaxID=204455 RepID=UPI000E083FDD